jgi:hypothetical protein
MSQFFFFLFVAVLLLGVPTFGFAILRSQYLEHSADQKEFLTGTLPSPAPEGFFQGYVGSDPNKNPGSWLGKSFDATTSTGVNFFSAAGEKNSNLTADDITPIAIGLANKKYPFATSLDIDTRSQDLNVFKLDYNVPVNPFWLRIVTDEIVQTSPGHYLGKLQVHVIPGYPLTMTFFQLQKAPTPDARE